ncbi:MAG TPA: rhodanese-like domain-containing protein [Anaeromyxobacteraceae bacterium]|nr:rhodanese-like domain-containing protein [Anaeromyxobacteraceae bacterium]
MTLRTPLVAVAAVGAAAALALAANRPARAEDGFALMSAADLAKVLGAADVAVFDANSDATYAKAHVPGAVHLDEYRRYPASTLPADKASRVVFYCKNTH